MDFQRPAYLPTSPKGGTRFEQAAWSTYLPTYPPGIEGYHFTVYMSQQYERCLFAAYLPTPSVIVHHWNKPMLSTYLPINKTIWAPCAVTYPTREDIPVRNPAQASWVHLLLSPTSPI